jgi:serine/threonine-protein kinase
MEFEKIGKYKIQGEIGSGAMGVVYKAVDPVLARTVAIKMISAALGADDDLRKRFHREAQAAARLNHPNIITVYDFGEEQGKIYMAMELLEGTDLKDVMAAGTLATLDDKLAVMEQILDGLAFAHAKEVVHRDLKPGNIHIQPNGQIKIMDFGLARLGSSEMTQAGVVMGTPNYMSPEQVLGEKVDSRSDIFAMGAVFYELLTSHKPFEAESMHGVLFQVVHKEPTEIRRWAPDLPPVLVQIVEKCLVKDKTKRFQNAGELREAVGVARQALAAGRINEATLDMDSGKVFFDAEEFIDDGSGETIRTTARPMAGGRDQWVEGTVALDMDQAPLEQVLESPASQSHPTLSGRARTQVGRPVAAAPAPVAAPSPSRVPLYIGGAILSVGLIIGGVLLVKSRSTATGWDDPLVLMLADQNNEIAQGALEDKEYQKAIDKTEQTIQLLKTKGAPEDAKPLVAAQKVLNDARTRFTAIESAAADAEDAFNKKDLDTAAAKLAQLIELDAQHQVAKNLGPKLSQQFKATVVEQRRLMADAREAFNKVNESASAEFRSEGRNDFGKAEAAADAAEAAVKKEAFGEATAKFTEARDAYDRGRRAIENKMADAAKANAQLRAQLKVPAEEARTRMTKAQQTADQAGAKTNPAAQAEYNAAMALIQTADNAFKAEDYPTAKKAFDDARIAFDRSRQAIDQAKLKAESEARAAEKAAADKAIAEKLAAERAAAEKSAAERAAAEKAAAEKTAAERAAAEKAAAEKAAAEKLGALAALRRPLVARQTTVEGPTKKGKAGLDESEPASPDFTGEVEFEAPPAIAAGESFSIKTYLKNTGRKPMKLKELEVTLRVNNQGLPQKATPLAKEIGLGERALIHEMNGSWPGDVDTWTLRLKAVGERGEGVSNRLILERKK